MDWKAELQKLPALQTLDRELDGLRADQRGLAGGEAVAELVRRAAVSRDRLGRLRAERESAARQMRKDDLDRQSEEAEKKRLTDRLYGGSVRNARDLEGMQKNLEGCEERIGLLETRVLEAMERDESLGVRIAELEQALSRDEAAAAERRAADQRRLDELSGAIAESEARRRDMASEVAAPVLREYDRVRGRAAGVGIGVVGGKGICGACGVALPPLLLSRVHRGESLVTCEHCGRLLVEEPR